MNKIYPPKKGALHFFIIWFAPTALLVAACLRVWDVWVFIQHIDAETLCIASAIFFVYSTIVWFLTQYRIQGDELTVRFGVFMFWSVNILEIVKIEDAVFVNKAPALSLDLLKIKQKNGREIAIAPQNKKEFLQDLLKINPSIRYDKSLE